MRYLVSVVVVSVLSAWGLSYYLHCERVARADAAEHAEARRIASLISSADSVIFRREGDKPNLGVELVEPAWIRNVSNAVAAAHISRRVDCMCIGWRTAHFTRDGKEFVRVAAIHGNQLRVAWDGGGGDFPIDEADWKAIAKALEAPTGRTAWEPSK